MSTPTPSRDSYADRIAMCQNPEGPHEHVPLKPGEDSGSCFMGRDCCEPRVYVALDAVVEAPADEFTDYRCLNGHIFSVPWGDEPPRSSVICPVCTSTGAIHGGAGE